MMRAIWELSHMPRSRIAVASFALLAIAVAVAAPMAKGASGPPSAGDGIVQVRSAYGVTETVGRLKSDIASKGIAFFAAIDQSDLASKAGIRLHPSTLLVFGNPALGVQFITSNPLAGLDWPVRLLVYQDEAGVVWTAYTDFDWIARRHQIANRGAAFAKASEVIASITSSIKE
jgi:uncharacterized protein (DUF302 family)